MHGGIAINQSALIKPAHLFCIDAPANQVASLNCGPCRAITGAGVTGEERDNLTSVSFNDTSQNKWFERQAVCEEIYTKICLETE